MRNASVRHLIVQVALLFWLAAAIIVFIYYPGSVSILHGSRLVEWSRLSAKLPRIDLLAYLGSLGNAFGGALLYALSNFAAGSTVLRLQDLGLHDSESKSTARAAAIGTAFLFGQAMFSGVFLTLAYLKILEPTHVIPAMALGLLIGARPGLRLVLGCRKPLDEAAVAPPDRLLQGVIALLALLILGLSLFYATGRLSYDSVALYFSDAKITALTHQIQFFQNDSFIVSAFHSTIHYSALIQVFGDQAARLYSWINGIIILTIALTLAHEAGLSKAARLILLVLIVTSTAILDLMGDGKVDLASTAPALGAVYWMAVSATRPSVPRIVMAGSLIGLAIIARPFNVVLLPVFTFVLYLQVAFSRRADGGRMPWGELLRPVLIAAVPALALAAVHLAFNWMILGDAFAPITNYAKIEYDQWQWAFDPRHLYFARFLYPVFATYVNSPQSLGNISPLVIAHLPLLLLRDKRSGLWPTRQLRYLVVAAVVSLFVWLVVSFTIFELRYVLVLWIVLFLPIAVLIDNTWRGTASMLRFASIAGTITLLGFTVVRTAYVSLDTYSPIDRSGNAHCYDQGMCTFIAPINRLAPLGARVLTLNAFRYYLRTDLFACSTSHSEYAALKEAAAVGMPAFWDEVYRQGYEYILYEWNYAYRHLYMPTAPDPSEAPAWIHLVPISGRPGDEQVAYRIYVDDPPSIPRADCHLDAAGIWRVLTATIQ